MTPNELYLGRVGYEAYGQHTRWQTYDGRAMPQWDDLSDRTREAWAAAAAVVADEVRPDPVDE